MNTQVRGQRAENDARLHLEKQGFHLIEKNFRSKAGEIDLIMAKGSLLIFVEVRLRTRSDCGSGAESVTRQKQHRLIRTASFFLQSRRDPKWESFRFDVVAIEKEIDWSQVLFLWTDVSAVRYSLWMRNLLLSVLILLQAACGGGGGGSSSPPPAQVSTPEPEPVWEYTAPEDLADGWSVSNLDAQELEEASITELMTNLIEDNLGIDGVAIARNGRLVLDERIRSELATNDTEAGNSDIELHAVYSITKSVNATLVGKAVEQGLLDVDNQILTLFPQYEPFENNHADKESMTVANFLTMRHGLTWDELTQPYGDPDNSLSYAIENCTDYVKCLLDLPMDGTPGETFSYSTHVSLTLGALVEQESGMDYQSYADTHFFEPLQISNYLWNGLTPTGRTPTGSGLFLTTRDMTKLGQLYLDGGTWNGNRLIPASWVTTSTNQLASLPEAYVPNGYGYQWWTYDFSGLEAFAAVGYGGQYVIVIPEESLVVTFTSNNYLAANALSLPLDLLVDYILPALQ